MAATQAVGRLHHHVILVDATEGQIIEDDAHRRQAQRPTQLETGLHLTFEDKDESHQSDVVSYQQETPEDGHTYLQHPIAVEKDCGQRNDGTQQQDAKQAPRRLGISRGQCYPQWGKIIGRHPVSRHKMSYRLTHSHHQKDGHHQQINGLDTLYHTLLYALLC